MGLLAWILIGLIAGLIARALYPGPQPMGLVATTLLGMIGSLVGGIIGSLFSERSVFDLHPSGIVLSVVGAILCLLLLGVARARRVRA